MKIADAAKLSLEGYRIQVIEKLKAIEDPAKAHDLIDQVESVLKAADLSKPAQRTFWEALYTDLDVIAEEWAEILGKEAAEALGSVIAAAKIDVRRYL